MEDRNNEVIVGHHLNKSLVQSGGSDITLQNLEVLERREVAGTSGFDGTGGSLAVSKRQGARHLIRHLTGHLLHESTQYANQAAA